MPDRVSELAPEVSSRDLGKLLRRLRRSQRLTLIEVAERSGLSHSFISQLERGLTQASMMSLQRIATALGTNVQVLMARDDSGPVSLVRAAETPVAREPGSSARPLINGSRAMQGVEIAGISTRWTTPFSHAGDEFLYVLAGCVEVELDGQVRHRLEPGDTVYYDGGTSHRWRRVGRAPLRVLLISQNPLGTI